MNFSQDRDLLVLEPMLLRDVPVMSQQRVRADDGVVEGTTLTSASSDFVAAQVQAGHVVLVAGVACEVLSREDEHTLTISLVRDGVDDPPIPPGDGESLSILVRTFAPQAGVVNRLLRQMLQLDDSLPSTAILSPGLLAHLEALGTLERIYTGAIAITGDNASLHHKAAIFHDQFNTACREAVIVLDLDGDGHPDAARSLGHVSFERR